MCIDPDATLNQPLEDTQVESTVEQVPTAQQPAYIGEIYQIYKANADAKILPIDSVFAAVEQALKLVPQPAEELAKLDQARRIPSIEQRLQSLNKDSQ